MDCSPPGSSFRGIFQARILEWVSISFSRWSPRHRDWTQVSCIAGRLFTIWTTREAPHINLELLYLHHELNTLSSCSDHVLYPYKMVCLEVYFIWLTSLRKQHNIVNQLYFNKKNKVYFIGYKAIPVFFLKYLRTILFSISLLSTFPCPYLVACPYLKNRYSWILFCFL